MCRDFELHDFVPFLIILMALVLSWKNMFLCTLKPCASIKCVAQMVLGKKSLTPTTSASVELFVLSFCLAHPCITTPLPIDIVPPVCPRMSRWMAYDESTHEYMYDKPHMPMIRRIFFVPIRYDNTLISFSSSPIVGAATLVQRKLTAVSISIRTRFAANSNFAVVWWNFSVSLSFSGLSFFYTHVIYLFNNPCISV